MIGHGEHSHINVSKVIAICRHKIAQDVLLEQFVGYLLFMVLFSICVLLQRNPAAANGVAAALKNRILATPFRDDGYELKTWSDIRSVDDWWDWHATVLMDTFYVDEYYSGTETSMYDQQKVMQHIKLIDGIRITQRRVLNGTCLVDNRRFSMFLSHCYGPTAADGRVGFTDKTGFTGAATGRLYSYQEISAFEGGYYAHLGGGGLREASRATLEGLRRDRWLNAGTSWVRTDFGAFNANVGLFSAVVLQMAIAPSGSVSPTFWVESLPYQPYATTLDYVRLTLECIFMASLLVFVAQEAQIIVFFARQARWERDRREGGPGRFMRRDVLAFLGNFWCVFDCHLLLGMMACVGLRAYIVLSGPFDNIEVPALTAERPALAVTDKDGKFLDVTQLALASWLYSVFCGLIVGGSSLKIVRFLRANVPLSVLTQTFVEMGMEVMLFFAILTLILTIWAAMAVTQFGSTVSEFRDLAASWQTCYLLFIGVTSREDVFRELPTDEFRGLPVEADIFFYPFTLVMTFVILNVSTGIIMTSYTKVTHNFDALQRHSLIDVLVQRAFTDQLSDAYLVWKIRARLRVASFERNVLALCRRHSAETLARPDVEYISDEQLLGIMHKVAMAATAGEGYDEALANVESIHMNPDSGLFPQYLDPKLADLVPHHIVVPASLVVKMAARENIGTDIRMRTLARAHNRACTSSPMPAHRCVPPSMHHRCHRRFLYQGPNSSRGASTKRKPLLQTQRRAPKRARILLLVKSV